VFAISAQNLMKAALHGSSQGLVANIRRVLGELHRSKKLGGVGSVDSMLVRLYEPILFRALAAANAGVRRNALQLLLDAFPLLVRGQLAASSSLSCSTGVQL
jgi:condensin-2 complex subunit G2